MSDPFIEKLNEKHLCSWYILPLLDLNVEAFGFSNFVNGYQVKGTYLIAIQVLDMHLCADTLLSQHYEYGSSLEHNDYLLFQIPAEWRKDYEMFLSGKYSKMSEEAKQKIREMSGLKYEVADECGNKLTDAILMALDNHPVLRRKWVELINTTDYWIPEELLSPPAESSFITIESL